jgi:hypothetical protein
MRRFAVIVLSIAGTSSALAIDLYNNGGLITNPGAGLGGANVSQCPATYNTAGYASVANGFTSKVADNFTVPAGGWTVDSIVSYGYMTSTYPNPPVASPLTGVTVEIWNGEPGAGGAVIHTSNAIMSNSWTGIYRVFNTQLTNAQRPVFQVEASFPSIALAAGNYWVSYGFTGLSPTGGTTGFTPMVSGVDGLGNPTVVPGNGKNFFTGAWTNTMGGAPIQGNEWPFIVRGVPEPSSLALLALSGLFAFRRR